MSDGELENIETGANPDPDKAGEEEQKEEQEETEKLKTKPVSAVVTLLAGAAVAIDVYIQKFPMWKALICILATLIIFLVIGDIVKLILDRIRIPIPKEVSDEGEMIEKGSGGSQEGEGTPEEEEASGTEEAPAFNGTEDVMTEEYRE